MYNVCVSLASGISNVIRYRIQSNLICESCSLHSGTVFTIFSFYQITFENKSEFAHKFMRWRGDKFNIILAVFNGLTENILAQTHLAEFHLPHNHWNRPALFYLRKDLVTRCLKHVWGPTLKLEP